MIKQLICKHFGHRTGAMDKLSAGVLIGQVGDKGPTHYFPPDQHQAHVYSTCRRCGIPFAVGTLMRPDEWRPQGNLGPKHVRSGVHDEVDHVIREFGPTAHKAEFDLMVKKKTEALREAIFKAAPRFHAGGIALALSPNEKPVVLDNGCDYILPESMRSKIVKQREAPARRTSDPVADPAPSPSWQSHGIPVHPAEPAPAPFESGGGGSYAGAGASSSWSDDSSSSSCSSSDSSSSSSDCSSSSSAD